MRLLAALCEFCEAILCGVELRLCIFEVAFGHLKAFVLRGRILQGGELLRDALVVFGIVIQGADALAHLFAFCAFVGGVFGFVQPLLCEVAFFSKFGQFREDVFALF